MMFGCWRRVYLHRSAWIPEICGALAKSLLLYFFSAQMHLPTSLKGWSPFIWISGKMLQHRIESNAKEAQSTVTAFQVARFLLCAPLGPPPPLRICIHIPCQEAPQSKAKVSHCLAHTYYTPRVHTLTPDCSQGEPSPKHSRCTCHDRSTSLGRDSPTLIGAGEKSSWVTAEDKWRHRFQSNFPQSAFGTSSIHNSKLEERMSAKHE